MYHLNLWVVDTGNELLSPTKDNHSVLPKTRRVTLSGENLFKHLFKANNLSQIMLKTKKPGRFWHSFEASITVFNTFISQWLQIWSWFDSEYSFKTTKNKRNTFLTIKSVKDFKKTSQKVSLFFLDCFHLIIQGPPDGLERTCSVYKAHTTGLERGLGG